MPVMFCDVGLFISAQGENTMHIDSKNMTREERNKAVVNYYEGRMKKDITNFFNWKILAILTGVIVGGASSVFAGCIKGAIKFRTGSPWVFLFLPIAGLIIVFMYQMLDKDDRGTNQVLSTIRSKDDVPIKSAPLIFVATLLTHLTGGSAGREGAAIQFGGSIGNQLGRIVKLDEFDQHVMVMCGMSAAFSAVFGTPMAAAVFAMEVVSVGVMYYAALLPCVIASIIAAEFAAGLGIHPEVFNVTNIPEITIENGLKMGVIAAGCGAVSILFCIALKIASKIYTKCLKNPYIRVFVAGCVVIVITLFLNTSDYMGAGSELIARAINGRARPLDFVWKMVLTAITMRAGFRGGEIVPGFCIGATFGCVCGQIIGFPPELAAAAGMVAVFCSAVLASAH